ncbi:MAG: hypothetical protein AB4911_20250 [Oscillochloridaceae bacterium umkhey_bin13]
MSQRQQKIALSVALLALIVVTVGLAVRQVEARHPTTDFARPQ